MIIYHYGQNINNNKLLVDSALFTAKKDVFALNIKCVAHIVPLGYIVD